MVMGAAEEFVTVTTIDIKYKPSHQAVLQGVAQQQR